MTTIVDSPLPSEDGPSACNPPPRSGVPLALAELCRWEIHECEIAASILLADRAETDHDEIAELRVALHYLRRLIGFVDLTYGPRNPFDRDRLSELVTNERLKSTYQFALFRLAVWRWEGHILELSGLCDLLQGRIGKLETSLESSIGKAGAV